MKKTPGEKITSFLLHKVNAGAEIKIRKIGKSIREKPTRKAFLEATRLIWIFISPLLAAMFFGLFLEFINIAVNQIKSGFSLCIVLDAGFIFALGIFFGYYCAYLKKLVKTLGRKEALPLAFFAIFSWLFLGTLTYYYAYSIFNFTSAILLPIGAGIIVEYYSEVAKLITKNKI